MSILTSFFEPLPQSGSRLHMNVKPMDPVDFEVLKQSAVAFYAECDGKTAARTMVPEPQGFTARA